MKTHFLFVSLLIFPVGAAAQESPQPSTAPEVRACTAVVPGADLAGWQEVRATGFTFCVPAHWRPSGRGRNGVDARTWRGGGGEVTWGTGTYNARKTVRRVVVVTVGDGAPPPPPAPTAGGANRSTEVIGGSPADLWNNEFEGDFYTGAKWTSPSVYVAGEARDRLNASLQLQVYRTVRFSQP